VLLFHLSSHFTDSIFRRPESLIAPYLTSLQLRLKPHGIQIGSYPILGQGVFVSLIGRDLPTPANGKENKQIITEPSPLTPLTNTLLFLDNCDDVKAQTRLWLAEVAQEVEIEVGGKVVSEEEVALKRERSFSSGLNQSASTASAAGEGVAARARI
jgi:hypothetical protein